MGLLDAASSGGSNAGLFIAIRALSLSLSRLSLSLLAPSPPRFVRDEATVFSRVDLEINGFN
eukprot:scaffold284926_cov35-Attheya_sp.AAC.1